MGQVLIRNLPDDVIETYKTKARLKGKSLEQELRDQLIAHQPFTPEERLAYSRDCLSRFTTATPELTEEQEAEEGVR